VLVLALASATLGATTGWSQSSAPKSYVVLNFAGTGEKGFDGDGGPASEAQLFDPWGLALDHSGSLFIADQLNHKIRKIEADGTISTVAGTGTPGYSGDSDAATAATLKNPCGVAADSEGNVYIADTGNHVIRKISPNGNISTIAGTGEAGYAGDGGKGTEAKLNYPIGLWLDASGNLFIADSFNHRIRKLAPDGIITTVAGNGEAGWSGDGGSATEAKLNYPQGVFVDAAGNIFIADTFNSLIRKVDPDGIITRVAGIGFNGYFGDGGPALEAGLDYPKSIAADAEGNLLIVDSFSSRIRLITPDGLIFTVAGNGWIGDSGDGGPALEARLRFPSALVLDGAGHIYISDTQNNRIRLLIPVASGSQNSPVINQGGVVTASAFGASRIVAPGSWIEIYGSRLASAARAWTLDDFKNGRAPTSLAGTRVTIDGQEAFLSYVSPNQVNALLPWKLSPGRHKIRVITSQGASTPYEVTVASVSPALYAPPSFIYGGRQYVAAVSGDGSAFVAPPGALPGLPVRRARPGETIVLFGVGFGPVSPNVDAGTIAQQASELAAPLEVHFGNTPADVISYKGLAPGAVGLYQINVQVPAVTPGDDVPLTIRVGEQTVSQQLFTTIAP